DPRRSWGHDGRRLFIIDQEAINHPAAVDSVRTERNFELAVLHVRRKSSVSIEHAWIKLRHCARKPTIDQNVEIIKVPRKFLMEGESRYREDRVMAVGQIHTERVLTLPYD